MTRLAAETRAAVRRTVLLGAVAGVGVAMAYVITDVIAPGWALWVASITLVAVVGWL